MQSAETALLILDRGLHAVTPVQQLLQLANARKRILAAFRVPSLLGSGQSPPQPHLTFVESKGMTPTSFDGGPICLWLGEFIAFMRDRTLDEGNDLGQTLSGQMGVKVRSVKHIVLRVQREQGVPEPCQGAGG